MKVLIVAPLVVPVGPVVRYQGIERLAFEYACEMLERGHNVTLVGAEGSIVPKGMELIALSPGAAQAEMNQYQVWHQRVKDFEIIHDFSHFHCPAMANKDLPTLNVFWHDPFLAKYPEPKQNVISISQYGAANFQAIYGQQARFQETIEVDPSVYGFHDSRNDRYLTVGKMSPEKGNLEAMRLCRKMGVGLDVVGGTMEGDDQGYDRIARRMANGQIRYWGNAADADKIKLMQSAKALIYCIGQLEIHSHKAVEAMMTGCPVITYNMGAMKEVVGDHFAVVETEEEFIQAMLEVGQDDCRPARDHAIGRWGRVKVFDDYLKLYEQVAGGLRW